MVNKDNATKAARPAGKRAPKKKVCPFCVNKVEDIDYIALAKEMEKVNAEYTKLSAMLNNQGFVTKAPEAKVKEIKDRVEELTGMLKNLEELQKKYR